MTFPPGWARLFAYPKATGSAKTTHTMGIVLVSSPHGVDGGGTSYHDDIDLEVHQLCGKGPISVRVAFCPAILDRHGLALDPAHFAQAFKERRPLRAH